VNRELQTVYCLGLLLLASAFFLGFLHGLGPDHLMAIAALSMDGGGDLSRRGRAVAVAVRFAMGHALLLSLGAGLIVLIGWSIPEPVERGGEMLGGALLVVMGLLTLQHLRLHATGHAALRTFYSRPSPEHGALRAEHSALSIEHEALNTEHSALSTQHSHVPTMIGAAFAVSSLRALAMLTPFGADLGTAPLPLLAGLIAVFAVGILCSMVLFGVVLAGILSTHALQRVGHGAGALVGISSVILGVAWVVTA
jgi:nickel/cobalt exporter